MTYGTNIGDKFFEDGTVRRYPGNTCVADLLPESRAFAVMTKLRDMLLSSPLKDFYIPLPADSYHMTVLSGLNDQKRMPTNWPACLSAETPMEEVDDYVAKAFEAAGIPDKAKMRFQEAYFGKSCIMIRLEPASEEEKEKLLSFRERGAEAVGVRLPNHENYRFHISLAYTRIIPEGKDREILEALKKEMDEMLQKEAEFETDKPYMAFFDDMFAFHKNKIPR